MKGVQKDQPGPINTRVHASSSEANGSRRRRFFMDSVSWAALSTQLTSWDPWAALQKHSGRSDPFRPARNGFSTGITLLCTLPPAHSLPSPPKASGLSATRLTFEIWTYQSISCFQLWRRSWLAKAWPRSPPRRAGTGSSKASPRMSLPPSSVSSCTSGRSISWKRGTMS